MKFTLLLASLVLLVFVSAHETEDSKNSELAEAADVELRRVGREAKKKERRRGSKRGKKGGRGKKKNLKKKKSKKGKKPKKGKKSKKNRSNKKKQRTNDEKLFCCCNKDTGENICKKDTKICPKGSIVCDKPPTPTPVGPGPPTSPTTCPPTSCPTGCEADLVKKFKELKKVSNWIKQHKRVNTFLERTENKKGKSDYFSDASLALTTATMNGTMCGLEGPDAEANYAAATLTVKNNCKDF